MYVIYLLSILLLMDFKILNAFKINFNNNVCKNRLDYSTKWFNPNCWYNPDVQSSPSAMILRHGYYEETYQVVTEDGYILTLFRVARNANDFKKQRQPILIQHGAITNSAIWVDTGNRSLAFRLADLGYDVWLGNMRGTMYARSHIYLVYNSPDYWNFSMDDLAYDVAADLKFIVEKTGQKAIYIGHSMGTTMSFFYAASRKKEADNSLRGIIALAPIAYVDHSPLIKLLSPFTRLIEFILLATGNFGVLQVSHSQHQLIQFLCLSSPIGTFACETIIYVFSGLGTYKIQPQYFPLIFSYYPDGLSTRTIVQYGQIAFKKKVIYYDYVNKDNNLKKYGQKEAPEYDLAGIDLPVHLFYSKPDLLSREKDVIHLYNTLKTKEKHLYQISLDGSIQFSHADFLYSKYVEEVLYKPLFAVLEKLTGNAK